MSHDARTNRRTIPFSQAHTNDLYNEQDIHYSESLSRNAQQASYIEELKARLNKLAERESSTEGYVRDIEAKLKATTDLGDSRSTEIIELKKDITRFRETEGASSRYIADIEARLAKSDATHAALASHVERLEKEVTRREELYRELEQRLQLIDTHKDSSKLLLRELEEKDRAQAELERKYDEAIREKDALNTERLALQEEVRKSDVARQLLQDKHDETRSVSGTASKRSSLTGTDQRTLMQQGQSPLDTGSTESSADPFFTPATELSEPDLTGARLSTPSPTGDAALASAPTTPKAATTFPIASTGYVPAANPVLVERSESDLDAELRALQETHSRTLAELEEVTVKYRDALRDISGLHNQVQEAQLVQGEAEDVVTTTPPLPYMPSGSQSEAGDEPPDGGASSIDSSKQELSAASSSTSGSSPTQSRRVSLTPATPRRKPDVSRRRESVPISPNTARDFRVGGGRPMSLSQEVRWTGHPSVVANGTDPFLTLLTRQFSSLPSSRTSWGGPPPSLLSSTSPIRQRSTLLNSERSIESLEQEIMTLQKVGLLRLALTAASIRSDLALFPRFQTLKLREDEIDQLEKSLQIRVLPPPHEPASPSASTNGVDGLLPSSPSPHEKHLNGLHSTSPPPSPPETDTGGNTPLKKQTLATRASEISLRSTHSEDENHRTRLEELMR